MRLPKRGSYTGRLAFDPDTLFHTDPDGRRVVTDDEGRSWRYATKRDVSHNGRYERRVAVVAATTPDDPHHHEPHPEDAHAAGLTLDDDVIGHERRRVHDTVEKPRLIGRGMKRIRVPLDEVERGNPASTSHTDAWKDA